MIKMNCLDREPRFIFYTWLSTQNRYLCLWAIYHFAAENNVDHKCVMARLCMNDDCKRNVNSLLYNIIGDKF